MRYAGESEYVKYESFKNPENNKFWEFSKDDAIVGFYFLIKNLKESFNVVCDHSSSGIKANTYFIKKDILQSGQLNNFCYIQTYFKDNDGNLVLQNEPELNSYSNIMT